MSFEPLKAAPKLSGVLTQFKAPETQFQSMVKSVTKLELPPGPLSMGTRLGVSFEKGQTPSFSPFGQAPEVQKMLGTTPFGKLPKINLPKIGPLGGDPLSAIKKPVDSLARGASTAGSPLVTDAELLVDKGGEGVSGIGGTGGEEKSNVIRGGKIYA